MVSVVRATIKIQSLHYFIPSEILQHLLVQNVSSFETIYNLKFIINIREHFKIHLGTVVIKSLIKNNTLKDTSRLNAI